MLMSDSFVSEADMYPSAAACKDVLASTFDVAVNHFFQVKAAVGIPDLVLAIFDDQELEYRSQNKLTPIVDAPDVAAMSYLGNRWSEKCSTLR